MYTIELATFIFENIMFLINAARIFADKINNSSEFKTFLNS
jgi:hypothetical protein